MLRSSAKTITMKNSVGSKNTIKIYNTYDNRVFFFATSNYVNCFTLCGEHYLKKWLDPKEKFEISIEYVIAIERNNDQPLVDFLTREGKFQIFINFDDEQLENLNERIEKTVEEVETYEAPKKEVNRSLVLIECPICCESYNENEFIPRMLKECGHTVCEKCARELMKNNDGKEVVCPFDRKTTLVNDDVDKLPRNFAVLQLLEEKKKEIIVITDSFLKCSTHFQENSLFYCTSLDCTAKEKLMCQKCMAENGKHEGHSYTSSKKVIEYKEKIKEKLKKTDQIENNLKNHLNLVDEQITLFDYEFSNQVKELKESHLNKIELIQEEQRKELMLFQEDHDKNRKSLEENQERIRLNLEKTSSVRKVAEEVLAAGIIDNELMEAIDQLDILN